jgi:hypothetical protein
MKHKLLLSAIVIFTVVFSNSKIFGQDIEEAIVPKVFGLGLHLEKFNSNNVGMNISYAPANKIVLTITPLKHFRLEPEIGFIITNDKGNDLKDKSMHYGIGAFGMYQRGKTNIYAGLRYIYIKTDDEYNDFSTSLKKTSNYKSNAFGPAIGAEYFFAKHFSIGGEVGLQFFSVKLTNNQYGPDNKTTYISTDEGFLLRFYF